MKVLVHTLISSLAIMFGLDHISEEHPAIPAPGYLTILIGLVIIELVIGAAVYTVKEFSKNE